jgi:uncharacterized protein YaaN involved in tellurite resistance
MNLRAGSGAIAAGRAQRIDAMVADLVSSIITLDPNSAEYGRRISDINGLGEREIVATAQVSSRLLDRPLRAMSGVVDGTSPIARDLLELRRIVEDLDPARNDLARLPGRRFLGLFRGRDRLRTYFDRYTNAQGRLQVIIRALDEGRTNLLADSAAIGQDERVLATEMETLRQYAYMAQALDEALERQIDELQATDPVRARHLRDDVLFAVRQRHRDILTQLAVASQGSAALHIVQDNNEQLIRAIQTVTTTTVAALRTAVMVARSMTDQRLVMDQIQAATDSAERVVESGAALVSAERAAIEAGAAGTDLAALQRAWHSVALTLNQIETVKSHALQTMVATNAALSEQLVRSQALAADRAEDSTLRIP